MVRKGCLVSKRKTVAVNERHNTIIATNRKNRGGNASVFIWQETSTKYKNRHTRALLCHKILIL